ncbi:sodium-dependent dicarboxylate transporter 2/3/5 [Spinactinospora alkalitolerans]|uniref:Sodium-dependent dicarboxylate transporter SdcS n=1 Tax=Spinactinospora alkalitolerans TaxID=687207 RepID=A0A852TYZ1_9ACTN|nr:DASS family sodium-coupled anion symporter [Spinactinospora alkalitolerans]NYE48222.1 sodium-dependent dicarboxylate transporter 2/3/5 [Spinactinospora alkalitolerans]
MRSKEIPPSGTADDGGPAPSAAADPGGTAAPSAAPADRMPRRQAIGLLLGPILGIGLFLLMTATVAELSTVACAVAGITVLMAVWWMTEAIPFAVTALLPLALFPLVGAGDIGEVAAPYASETIFLFLGGFVIALAMQKWELHRRIALNTVLGVGVRPTRLIGGFMLASCFISMWVSSTATTMMMLPMGLSIVMLLKRDGAEVDRNFSTCLLLGIAYAATISTTATIVATPGNAFVVAYLAENHGIEIGFAQWMLIGTPLSAVFLVIAWLLLTRVIFPPRITEIPGGEDLIRTQLASLGRMGRGERIVAVLFACTALSWIFIPLLNGLPAVAAAAPWLGNVSEAGIAVIAAIAFFLIPVRPGRGEMLMRWEDAKEIPWGILLMFGGGLSMSKMITDSGLSAWIGDQVGGLSGIPAVALVVVVAVLMLFFTELTSTTATITTYVPVMAGIAGGLGLAPLVLVLPTVFAAGFAFMLPVATPPNAIVVGSGHVTIGQMLRGGIWLNLVGIALVPLAILTLGAWVFGLAF